MEAKDLAREWHFEWVYGDENGVKHHEGKCELVVKDGKLVTSDEGADGGKFAFTMEGVVREVGLHTMYCGSWQNFRPNAKYHGMFMFQLKSDGSLEGKWLGNETDGTVVEGFFRLWRR